MNCLNYLNKNKNKQLFTCYWGGYFNNENKYPQTLNLAPKYIDIIILAFVGPNKDSTAETTFLCSKYSDNQIIDWIRSCHNNGQKVFVSILDTPEVHWDSIDLLKFSKSLKSLIDRWGLDGVDIDAESGMDPNNYVETFINLAKFVKKEIGSLPLTYTCYTGSNGPDGPILKCIRDQIEYIQLMAYFFDFNSMINLYKDYSTIMGDKIIIGVKAGNGDGTPLSEVQKLCLWNNNKKGMMLWTLNRDTPQYTNKNLNEWSKTINDHLNSNSIFRILKFLDVALFPTS